MLALLLSAPARAQEAELPVYVSDQFRSVAKKASRQLITAHIISACPDNKPLCKPIVEQLAAATDAAISKDQAALQRALNTFFVQSSVAGLIEIVLGDLSDTEKAEYPELAQALEPVAQCLVASVMAGRQQGQSIQECRFEHAQLKRLNDVAKRLICPAGSEKCPNVTELILALEKRPMQVDEVAYGLARMLESPPLHRRREGLYLYALGDFLARAPQEGLFEATWSFLTLPERQPRVWERIGAAERFIASNAFLEYRLLNGSEDDQILEVLKACGQPTEAYQAWIKARSGLPALREALLVGDDVHDELQPLRALLDYQQCAGTDEARRRLRQLRDQIQEILVPLEYRSAVKRYGVLGLSAAALLDYVRSSNEQDLNANLARTTVFGVAQAVAFQQAMQRMQAERGRNPAPEARLSGLTVLSPGDLLGTCEFQRVSALMGQAYSVADLAKPTCFDLNTKRVAPGLSDIMDLGARRDTPAEAEAKAFAQLLKHAYFQQRAPAGVPTPEQIDQMNTESAFLLGELMASKAPAITQAWTEIRELLERIHASAGDLEARAKLQARAYSLAGSVQPPTSGPTLYEESFVQLMLANTTPEDEARLGSFWQQWLARKRQLEAQQTLSAAEQTELATLQTRSQPLPPLRMVRAYIDFTEEQRGIEMLKVLRGLLRTTSPDILERLEKILPINTVAQSVQDGLEKRDDESRRRMMRLGADFLVAQVDKVALRIVGTDAGKCQENDPKWRSILNRLEAACTAHMLIQGAYHPIADYLGAGGFSAPGAARLADTTYRQLLQSPMLASTPVILNVGLGANWVGFNKSGSDFVSLTVVDKFGVALLKYNGPSYGFEAGPFVGGFLDALVRTASGADEKYWLAGFAVGFPRVANVDLGLEAHVAGAIPFTFNSDPQLTLGLTVVVPFSTVLDSGE
ncbi:MAG TPA: hypothetical protein VF815_44580 [Myxococcaceae bacterium]|jgi:hypothetical protein